MGQSEIKRPFNEKIGPDNGLSSYSASKIIQDKFGFIWIATQDGLNRYDGRVFTIYSKSTGGKHRLLGNVINDMVQDTAQNILWVTTSYGGLNGIDLVTGTVVHSLRGVISSDGFHNDWLKCINICCGNLWLGTYDGLTVYDPGKGSFVKIDSLPFKKDSSRKDLNVNFVFVDRYAHVWVNFPDHGLAVYSGMTKKILHSYSTGDLGFHEEQKNHFQYPGRVAGINDSSFILATDHGFQLINYDREGRIKHPLTELPVNKSFRNTFIYSCAIDRSGKLWFSTSDHLYKADLWSSQASQVIDVAQKGKTDWLRSVIYILMDNGENVWIATEKGVAFSRNIDPPFIPYFEKNNSARINHAYYIYPQHDSVIYVCAQDGFFRVNPVSNDIINLDNRLSYYHCFEARDGRIIVSSDNGLSVYRSKNNFSAIEGEYPELKPLKKELINSAVFVGDSLTIMGSLTQKGIYLWNTKKHSLKNVRLLNETIPNNIINNVYKDSGSRIFILFDNAFATYDVSTGKAAKFQLMDPDQKIPLSLLFDICKAGNYYWMAVYGRGVVQMGKDFTIRKIYSFAEGLSNTGMYKVFPYKDSLLFATSNNGLFCIDIRTGRVRQYLKEDGLNSNNFEENCGYSNGDTFYAGGEDGISKISPSFIKNNDMPPRVFINDLKIESPDKLIDTFNLKFEKYNILNNTLQTRVYFSGINYFNSKRTGFSYKIKELNNEWILLGPQNFVDLIGLEPATYTLEVKAANENGVWSEPKQIILVFLPKWYQTLWFKLLVIAAISALLYALYRYRIGQIKRQQQIRKDIASDLHDDIGSILNTVKIFTHLAKREQQKEEHLTRIEDSLAEATMGLRDMIWVLDDSQDTIRELSERIKKFAIPITNANGIHFEYLVGEGLDDQPISKTEKRNLLLIAKETINNSIKYAECRNIRVSIKQVNSKIYLSVRDDGKGFDIYNLSQGNGLKNIAHRATQIHYRAEIISSPGNGTLIEVIEI